MRRLALAALVTVAALAGSLGLGGAAHALTGGPWPWHNTATLACLDSNPQGDLYTLACNGGPFQQWVHSQNQLGDQIRNHGTNRCLDTNPVGDIYTLPCNGGVWQRWTVTYAGAFGWEIRSTATSRCLDSNPFGEVYTHLCNGGNFQRWH